MHTTVSLNLITKVKYLVNIVVPDGLVVLAPGQTAVTTVQADVQLFLKEFTVGNE